MGIKQGKATCGVYIRHGKFSVTISRACCCHCHFKALSVCIKGQLISGRVTPAPEGSDTTYKLLSLTQVTWWWWTRTLASLPSVSSTYREWLRRERDAVPSSFLASRVSLGSPPQKTWANEGIQAMLQHSGWSYFWPLICHLCWGKKLPY